MLSEDEYCEAQDRAAPQTHAEAPQRSEGQFRQPGNTAAPQSRVPQTPKPSQGTRQHLRTGTKAAQRSRQAQRDRGHRLRPAPRWRRAPASRPRGGIASAPAGAGNVRRGRRRERARGGGAGPAAGGRDQAPGASQGLSVAAGRMRAAPYGSPVAAAPVVGP